MKTPEKLCEEAQKLRARIETLNRQSSNASRNAPGSFVTGASGRSRAQNKATERALEITIRNAIKCIELERKAKMLERQADLIESGEYGRAITCNELAKQRIKQEKKERKKLLKQNIKDRLFIGCWPTGYGIADRLVEVHGDYRSLAFIPYKTLEIKVNDQCPKYLLQPVVELCHKLIADYRKKDKEYNLVERYGCAWPGMGSSQLEMC